MCASVFQILSWLFLTMSLSLCHMSCYWRSRFPGSINPPLCLYSFLGLQCWMSYHIHQQSSLCLSADWLIVTCRLTACILGSAPSPTLGNKYGKPFTFFTVNAHDWVYNLNMFNLLQLSMLLHWLCRFSRSRWALMTWPLIVCTLKLNYSALSLWCVSCTEMPSSDEANMRRSTRSGRLLLPPLAFWANERLIVPHRRGTSAQLVIDNQSFEIFTDTAQVIMTVTLHHDPQSHVTCGVHGYEYMDKCLSK